MKLSFVLLITLRTSLEGQVNPAITGSGYTLPSPIYAAPGQLVTLVVPGLGSSVTQPTQAPGNANLPTTLAGISVQLWQGTTFSLPILAVQPFSPCGVNLLYSCNELAAVTVQIPFETQSILPVPCSSCAGIPAGYMNVLEGASNGGVAGEILVSPLADQVHLLTSCDTFMSSAPSAQLPVGLPCPQIVAHSNGSLATATNPAKAGEEVVAYAVGLGQTNPASVTGQLVTTSAPTQITFNLDFNFRPNALASRPLPTGPTPIYAGTTPGYVGLYQINFTVPPVPAGTPPCVDASTLPVGSNVVQSNLTVSIGGTFSFDGARICVAIN